LCFRYKNPEKKNQNPFQIKKYGTENNTFQKNLSGRDYCVPKKGIQNVILYAIHFFKGIFGFSPVIGCSDMVQEAIVLKEYGKFFLHPIIFNLHPT